ncbi:MAG: hypothetical protein JW839_17410 [Candidatus Lokiarchaeota archaeon]|nr:hypothetical protein [Candidatus Lokiarchaeota archaeon]
MSPSTIWKKKRLLVILLSLVGILAILLVVMVTMLNSQYGPLELPPTTWFWILILLMFFAVLLVISKVDFALRKRRLAKRNKWIVGIVVNIAAILCLWVPVVFMIGPFNGSWFTTVAFIAIMFYLGFLEFTASQKHLENPDGSAKVTMVCRNCGLQISGYFYRCPKCGMQL